MWYSCSLQWQKPCLYLIFYVITSVVVAARRILNFTNYFNLLNVEIWRFSEDFITVGGLSVLPQIMWSTFVPYIPNSIFAGAIAFVIAVTSHIMINDRYEFPLELDLDRENGKYLSPEADRSVRNLYTLHRFKWHSHLIGLSGILTVFFCGIVMSHYTWHNVTEGSRVTTNHAFANLSFVAETFIFLYVGMDALDIEKWRFVSDSPGTSVAVSSILIVLIMVGRAAFVFPLSFLINLFKKNQSEKLSLRKQVVIWWAGLMRGAVSMALAYNQFTWLGHTQLRANAILITSTITVVLFNTVFFVLWPPLYELILEIERHNID